MDGAVRGLAGRTGNCAGLRGEEGSGETGGGEAAQGRAGTQSCGAREAEWVQRGAPREPRSRPGRGSS